MTPELNTWPQRLINLSDHISNWSKDDIKVGAIIVDKNNKVLSTGYNGMPSWFNDDNLQKLGSDKSRMITHAEINSFNCLSSEHFEKDLTLYVNRPPCKCCTKAMIYSYINIKSVYYVNKTNKECKESLDLFDLHGITHFQLEL